MIGLIVQCPDIYIDEIQEQLEKQHNIMVSLATICRTLPQLGITYKKVCSAPVLHFFSNVILALKSCTRMLQRSISPIYTGDWWRASRETCNVVLGHHKCPYYENGWAPQGTCAQKHVRFTHGAGYVLDQEK